MLYLLASVDAMSVRTYFRAVRMNPSPFCASTRENCVSVLFSRDTNLGISEGFSLRYMPRVSLSGFAMVLVRKSTVSLYSPSAIDNRKGSGEDVFRSIEGMTVSMIASIVVQLASVNGPSLNGIAGRAVATGARLGVEVSILRSSLQLKKVQLWLMVGHRERRGRKWAISPLDSPLWRLRWGHRRLWGG